MINTILFYLFSSSALLFYGIGANRTLINSESFSSRFVSFIKCLIVAAGTSSLSFILNKVLLIPMGMVELYPFIAIVLFIIISLIVEILSSIGVRSTVSEFSVPFLSVLIALNEGITYAETVVISLIGVVVFYFMNIILWCLRGRIEVHYPDAGLKTISILMLSFAVIVIAVYGYNVSWLNLIE